MLADEAADLAGALEAFDMPLRRVVYTSSLVTSVGGSALFWQAGFYGTPYTADLLELPANVAGYRLIYPEAADRFDDELAARPVSHAVEEPAWLTRALQVAVLGGPQPENLAALVPVAGVAFAGALASFGTTPLGFEANPQLWADSLDALAEVASTIVPGQGPIGGPDDARALAAYLRACLAADGDAAAIGPGPWDGWSHRHFDEVNVERAALWARGEDRVPVSMLRLVGLA